MPVFVGLPPIEQQIKSLSALLDKFPEVDKSKYENPSAEELLACIASNASLLFNSDQDKEVKRFISEFCGLLQQVPENKLKPIVDSLVNSVSANSDSQATVRLTVLNYLYNYFPATSQFRYEIFLSILKFAKDSGNKSAVVPIFSTVETLFKQWGINVDQKRNVYKAMYEVKQSDSTPTEQGYQLLLRYLSTYDETSGDELLQSKTLAVDAAIQAIKLEDIHQFDELLELSAIKQLEKDEKFSKVYELLVLFAGEKLESFDSFNEKYPDYLESLGLQREDCLKKIRLLSLATLASEHNELQFSQIASTLNVAEEDVELWVIFAIAAKLIEAKIDQTNKVVIIHHYTQRVFTDKQWKQLQGTLLTWKDNVQELLNTLETSGGTVPFTPIEQL